MTWHWTRRNVLFTMRLPIRSETEAVRFVFAGGAVIVVSVLLGWLTTPLVGVAFFVVALVVGAIAYLRAPNPEHRTPFADAENEPHPYGGAPGKRHVVVVANQALSGDELRQRLTEMGERLELDVLAPVLTSHLHYAVSDIDTELAEARKRLDQSLAWARRSGFVARGEVGDPNPTTAIEDELRDFGADAVVVVTHPSRARDLAGARRARTSPARAAGPRRTRRGRRRHRRQLALRGAEARSVFPCRYPRPLPPELELVHGMP